MLLYWLHVTPAGVPVSEGSIGCRHPPRVSDGLPRNMLLEQAYISLVPLSSLIKLPNTLRSLKKSF